MDILEMTRLIKKRKQMQIDHKAISERFVSSKNWSPKNVEAQHERLKREKSVENSRNDLNDINIKLSKFN